MKRTPFEGRKKKRVNGLDLYIVSSWVANLERSTPWLTVRPSTGHVSLQACNAFAIYSTSAPTPLFSKIFKSKKTEGSHFRACQYILTPGYEKNDIWRGEEKKSVLTAWIWIFWDLCIVSSCVANLERSTAWFTVDPPHTFTYLVRSRFGLDLLHLGAGGSSNLPVFINFFFFF